ncbi:unnamed protein product, partial [Ectocarpus sp. 4 AP-2014]
MRRSLGTRTEHTHAKQIKHAFPSTVDRPWATPDYSTLPCTKERGNVHDRFLLLLNCPPALVGPVWPVLSTVIVHIMGACRHPHDDKRRNLHYAYVALTTIYISSRHRNNTGRGGGGVLTVVHAVVVRPLT